VPCGTTAATLDARYSGFDSSDVFPRFAADCQTITYAAAFRPTIRRGTVMTATHVRKSDVVSVLRSRGKFARADWFERTLPDIVDTGKNSSLLANLDIDPDALNSTDRIPQNA
jgi:hypothetical protein